MNIRQPFVLVAATALLCLALCFPSWTAVASAHDASFKLTEQSLDTLRKEGLPKDTLEKLKALIGKKFNTQDEFLKAVGQTIGNNQTVRYKAQILEQGAAEKNELKQLEQRLKELEAMQTARDDASRSIIRDAISTLGSKINEAVSLGGTLQVLAGASESFQAPSNQVMELNTAELDFEIQMNDWSLSGITFQYDNIRNLVNVDTAFFSIGDIQRFWPFLTAGRIIAPFGISTGDPVADVLSIEDPLTIEVFETKEDAILIGVALPTPAPAPAGPPVTPPPVRPLVINPLISSVSKFLGYKPPPTPPPPPAPLTRRPQSPPINAGIYFFQGDTQQGFDNDYKPAENYGATLGFRTRGDHLLGADFYPWSIDFDVDYINSVYDSIFLADEYKPFLQTINYVPGAAMHLKSTLGPVSLVAEVNGAIDNVKFVDGLGNLINLQPYAWQVSLGYQFDWNPWVEAIGKQGNYITLGYSESHDLEGVRVISGGRPIRIGTVPRRRIIVGVGEWVLDNLQFAIEYSYNRDYPVHKGGTEDGAHGVFAQLTAVW